MPTAEYTYPYFWDREIQKYWFAKQISLAGELKLPVIIHDRDAHEDVLNIIKKEQAYKTGGVFHAFSGSVEMARELVELGFYISVGGVVTFKNAKKIIDVVKYIPEDRLLLETDAPYLTPEPKRGKRNDSGNLIYILEKAAAIKGVEAEELAKITSENAIRLFGFGGE